MAGWKKNKLVAIVAGIIFVLSIVVTFLLLQPRKAPPPATPGTTPKIQTPASTPFIK